MTAFHAVPIGDAIAHEVPGRDPDREMPDCRWAALEADAVGLSCPCGPDAEQLTSPTSGRRWWRYTHHALDGRELHEVTTDGTPPPNVPGGSR